jgi:molybdate transport system substrate-binding protein
VRRLTSCWIVPVVVVLGLLTSGCGGDDGSSAGGTPTTRAAGTATGSITVSNAASLTAAFDEIGAEFMQANPDAGVTFNPGSSATLVTQIEGGAPADVFASADEANMDRLVTGNRVGGQPEVFARNRLVMVTKPGNPKDVRSLGDLGRAGIVALCAETVPCGKYAAESLQKANVTIPETSITRGADATATLAQVTQGDADAAIVYVTDARTAGNQVASVTIPDAQNVVAVYPIATLAASGNKAAARAFVEYVLSPAGQATLKSYGFLPPS